MSKRVAVVLLALGLFGCSDGGKDPNQPEPGPAQFASAASCGECHPNHLAEWESSMHAFGGVDPVMHRMNEIARMEAGSSGLDESCISCHAPGAERAGEPTAELLSEGVSCDVCHSMADVPPVADIHFLAELDPKGPKVAAMTAPVPTDAHDSLVRPFFATSTQCAPCHQVNFPSGEGLENTYEEWSDSNLSGMGIECQDCHMPEYSGQAAINGPTRENLHRHTFTGVDYAYEAFRGIDLDAQKEAIRALLRNSVTMTVHGLAPSAMPGAPLDFDVTIVNDRTGHSIPSGVSFSREMWIEARVTDGTGAILFHSGALHPNGDLVTEMEDPDLAFFGALAYDAEGAHTSMNFRAATLDESRMIPALGSRTHSYSAPIPPGAIPPIHVDVALRFRPVRPSMIRELGLDRLLPIEIFEMARFTADLPLAR
jgi:hypothetical protein